MFLREFFSHNASTEKDEDANEELCKDLMAFILDDDDVYKKLMIPILDKTKKQIANKTYSKKNAYKLYDDLVDNSCLAFYKKEKLQGDPDKHFPHKLRLKVARQLAQINHESGEEHENN